MDQAESTWESTPYAETEPTPSAGQRRARDGHPAEILRTTAFLLLAALAILVLLPAAIAAQAAFAV